MERERARIVGESNTEITIYDSSPYWPCNYWFELLSINVIFGLIPEGLIGNEAADVGLKVLMIHTKKIGRQTSCWGSSIHLILGHCGQRCKTLWMLT